MEYRLLGRSGLKVSALSFGAATFGGGTEFFAAWGNTGVDEARRMVDLCIDAGVNLFDVANGYSNGLAEEILGKALQGKRNQVLISTKAFFPMGDGPNDLGSSRLHLLEQCDASLKRLGIDHIDIYHMHGFDRLTPVEETVDTLNTLVHAGKVRYIACSNFSGWHLMKSLAVSARHGWTRYVAHQVYYSLIGREYEWELMPLGLDQGVGGLVGVLALEEPEHPPVVLLELVEAMVDMGADPPDRLAVAPGDDGPPVADEFVYRVVDALDAIAKETGKSIPQIALNWLLQRPTVSSVIIGARTEEQLRQNLEAADWNLTAEQVAKLDAASDVTPVYPYWHQRIVGQRNPDAVRFVPGE